MNEEFNEELGAKLIYSVLYVEEYRKSRKDIMNVIEKYSLRRNVK